MLKGNRTDESEPFASLPALWDISSREPAILLELWCTTGCQYAGQLTRSSLYHNNNRTAANIVHIADRPLPLRKAGKRFQHWFASCFTWLFIMLVIASCSTSGSPSDSSSNGGFSLGASPTSSSGNAGSGTTSTSPNKQGSSPINATVTYAGVTMTFVDAQQAPTFADDTNVPEGKKLLRLNFKEQTGAINGVYFYYTDVFQLIAPDGTTINAHDAQDDSAPGQSVSRANWVDFIIAQTIDVSKYTLRIGKATEEQINIPLTGKADLTKYQTRKATLNKKLTYGGVEFIITQATAALSANGPQAPKGKMYVVVYLTINNNTTHQFYDSLTQTRLRSGETTSPQLDWLASAEPGQTNIQDTQTYIMPLGSADFTLIFLPSPDNKEPSQVTADFRIP